MEMWQILLYLGIIQTTLNGSDLKNGYLVVLRSVHLALANEGLVEFPNSNNELKICLAPTLQIVMVVTLYEAHFCPTKRETRG